MTTRTAKRLQRKFYLIVPTWLYPCSRFASLLTFFSFRHQFPRNPPALLQVVLPRNPVKVLLPSKASPSCS